MHLLLLRSAPLCPIDLSCCASALLCALCLLPFPSLSRPFPLFPLLSVPLLSALPFPPSLAHSLPSLLSCLSLPSSLPAPLSPSLPSLPSPVSLPALSPFSLLSPLSLPSFVPCFPPLSILPSLPSRFLPCLRSLPPLPSPLSSLFSLFFLCSLSRFSSLSSLSFRSLPFSLLPSHPSPPFCTLAALSSRHPLFEPFTKTCDVCGADLRCGRGHSFCCVPPTTTTILAELQPSQWRAIQALHSSLNILPNNMCPRFRASRILIHTALFL